MKLSMQLRLARNYLAWTISEDDPEDKRYRWSCSAVAEVMKGYYFKDPGALWYFNWLLEHGAKPLYGGDEIIAWLNRRCDEESQSVRFMLLCFAELDAKDQGL